jgi:hypothetical protein
MLEVSISLTCLTSQMRKLRLGEVKLLAQDSTASKWEREDWS